MITPDQLRKICSEHKYIILRHYSGCKIAINCRVAFFKSCKWKKVRNGNIWVSWKPCDLHEYISYKIKY